MTSRTWRLRHSDILRALEEIDLLDVIADELVRRTTGGGESPRSTRPGADQLVVTTGTELTTVEEPDGGRVCQLPTPSLQLSCLAGTACLAARELLPPGAITAAVFGSGAAAQLHLELIARHLPNVVHAATSLTAVQAMPQARNVQDRLVRAGIQLRVTTAPRDAAVGANLLVVAELGWDRLDLGALRPGVLVINATRRDLPDPLLAQVDRIYVDDMSRLPHHQHRTFVRTHLARSPAATQARESTRSACAPDRPRLSWRHHRQIDTDLGHVLAARCGRADIDDIVLVELLDSTTLNARVARHIYDAAVAIRPGRHVDGEGKE